MFQTHLQALRLGIEEPLQLSPLDASKGVIAGAKLMQLVEEERTRPLRKGGQHTTGNVARVSAPNKQEQVGEEDTSYPKDIATWINDVEAFAATLVALLINRHVRQLQYFVYPLLVSTQRGTGVQTTNVGRGTDLRGGGRRLSRPRQLDFQMDGTCQYLAVELGPPVGDWRSSLPVAAEVTQASFGDAELLDRW